MAAKKHISTVDKSSIRVVSFKFLSLLIPSIAICAILVASVYACTKISNVEEEILEKLELIYSVHNRSIATPLWTLDYSGLENAMETIAIYPEITCVKVDDTSEDMQYHWPADCANKDDTNKAFKQQIFFTDKPIGYIYLTYTDIPAKANLYREILLGSIFLFTLIVVISIVALISLRVIVGRPLILLMESIRAAKIADISKAVAWTSKDEFGEVIAAYNSLIAQVDEKTSQLIMARDQAEIATEAKGQFLTKISHELRTPLNAVIGITEMLREEAEDEKRDTEAFDRVAGSGRHLLNLIDDILQYRKIEANKFEVSNTVFSVGDLLEEIVSFARPLVERNNNLLQVTNNCELALLSSNEQSLKQILINLLENASKFTNDGKIELAVQHSRLGAHSYFSFSVTDTGIGISEENKRRIFEEFVQADNSTTRQYGGTGLGLAISQGLCNLLGGEIGVRSELGKGSEFFFTLPGKPILPDGDGLPDGNRLSVKQ